MSYRYESSGKQVVKMHYCSYCKKLRKHVKVDLVAVCMTCSRAWQGEMSPELEATVAKINSEQDERYGLRDAERC